MGTSKGYIAPSTPHWSRTKRSVTSYLSDSSDTKKKDVVTKYSDAMNSSDFFSGQIAHAFSRFAVFVLSYQSKGINVALQEVEREDILEKPPVEALNELMLNFTNEGATIDDAIALDCLSEALIVLEVHSFNDLSAIDINRVIKELVCQFAKHKFAQLFDKQIRHKLPNVEEANAKISEIQEYIYYTMDQRLTPEILSSINPNNLADESIVQEIMKKGFDLLKEFYG